MKRRLSMKILNLRLRLRRPRLSLARRWSRTRLLWRVLREVCLTRPRSTSNWTAKARSEMARSLVLRRPVVRRLAISLGDDLRDLLQYYLLMPPARNLSRLSRFALMYWCRCFDCMLMRRGPSRPRVVGRRDRVRGQEREERSTAVTARVSHGGPRCTLCSASYKTPAPFQVTSFGILCELKAETDSYISRSQHSAHCPYFRFTHHSWSSGASPTAPCMSFTLADHPLHSTRVGCIPIALELARARGCRQRRAAGSVVVLPLFSSPFATPRSR